MRNKVALVAFVILVVIIAAMILVFETARAPTAGMRSFKGPTGEPYVKGPSGPPPTP